MEKFLAVVILLWQHVNCQATPISIYVPNHMVPLPEGINNNLRNEGLVLGNCKVVINDICPDPDIKFFLYTKSNPKVPEGVRIGSDPHVSNLTSTSFNPKNPVKIIIHGYNSDMYLNVLVEIKDQYLKTNDYNIFAIDWSPLCQSPCYIAALWNLKHVGACASQLVERIREFGVEDIHVIGFSLGAHVPSHLANALLPYKLPRVTGLDPAGPGFITASKENKLDKEDAKFVDVIHTNCFIQGLVEELGHVDFYLNGGIIQPGCWAESRFFACNHHRAPLYFAESINTQLGFWGWPCPSYFQYILGNCPPKDPQIIMGEHVNATSTGVHLVITESVAPFAIGKYTGPAIEIYLRANAQRKDVLKKYKRTIENFLQEESYSPIVYNRTYLKEQLYEKFADEIMPEVFML